MPSAVTNGARGSEEDIVLTGLSGRLPESDTIEEFAQQLFDGVDLVTADDRRWTPGNHFCLRFHIQCSRSSFELIVLRLVKSFATIIQTNICVSASLLRYESILAKEKPAAITSHDNLISYILVHVTSNDYNFSSSNSTNMISGLG